MAESDKPVGEQLIGPDENRNSNLHPNPVQSRPSLESLLSRITDEKQHPALDWGADVGKEIVE